jgi:acyl carrier protein
MDPFMKEQIIKTVNTVLDKKKRPQLGAFDGDLRLREDIGFDSLDLAELTVRIEVFSGVDIFEAGIVRTLGEVLNRLEVG